MQALGHTQSVLWVRRSEEGLEICFSNLWWWWCTVKPEASCANWSSTVVQLFLMLVLLKYEVRLLRCCSVDAVMKRQVHKAEIATSSAGRLALGESCWSGESLTFRFKYCYTEVVCWKETRFSLLELKLKSRCTWVIWTKEEGLRHRRRMKSGRAGGCLQEMLQTWMAKCSISSSHEALRPDALSLDHSIWAETALSEMSFIPLVSSHVIWK